MRKTHRSSENDKGKWSNYEAEMEMVVGQMARNLGEEFSPASRGKGKAAAMARHFSASCGYEKDGSPLFYLKCSDMPRDGQRAQADNFYTFRLKNGELLVESTVAGMRNPSQVIRSAVINPTRIHAAVRKFENAR